MKFAMLCVECALDEGALIQDRLEKALDDSQLHASVGIASRRPSQGLRWDWANAHRAMYSHRQASQQKTR